MLTKHISSAKETLDALTRDRDVAPWAASESVLHQLDLGVRLLFLLAAPLFFILCEFLGQRDVEIMTAGMLVVVSTVGSAEQLLERVPTLGTFRFLGPALRLTHDLHEHYRARRPPLLVLYLVYPLYALVGSIASPRVRAEVKLHATFLVLVAALLVVESAGEYWAVFRQHLSITDSLPILLKRLGLMVALVLAYVMPTTTTVYTLDLSGRRRMLRVIVVGVLLLCVPIVWAVNKVTERETSFASAQVLDLRMTKSAFRQDLRDIGSMFLSFHARASRNAQVGEAPVVHKDLTDRFRKVIQGDLPDDERLSFSIITFKEPGSGHVWMGLRYTSRRHPLLLMVASPSGAVIRKWGDLPPWIVAKFHVSNALDKRKGTATTVARRAMDAELPEE